MTIRFRCPGCNRKLSADDDDGGAITECPECSTEIEIPEPPPPLARAVSNMTLLFRPTQFQEPVQARMVQPPQTAKAKPLEPAPASEAEENTDTATNSLKKFTQNIPESSAVVADAGPVNNKPTTQSRLRKFNLQIKSKSTTSTQETASEPQPPEKDLRNAGLPTFKAPSLKRRLNTEDKDRENILRPSLKKNTGDSLNKPATAPKISEARAPSIAPRIVQKQTEPQESAAAASAMNIQSQTTSGLEKVKANSAVTAVMPAKKGVFKPIMPEVSRPASVSAPQPVAPPIQTAMQEAAVPQQASLEDVKANSAVTAVMPARKGVFKPIAPGDSKPETPAAPQSETPITPSTTAAPVANPPSAPAVKPPPPVQTTEPPPTPETTPVQTPPPLPQKETFGNCPKCNAGLLVPDAAICIECGHNLKLGINVKSAAKIKKIGKVWVVLVIAGVAALASGALWAVVAALTQREFGWIAIFVGAITGGTICLLTSERSVRMGLAALGLAFCGWFSGKLITSQVLFGTDEKMAKAMKKDDASDIEASKNLVMEMELDNKISEELAQAYEDGINRIDPPERLKGDLEALKNKVNAKVKNMSPQEKAELEVRLMHKTGGSFVMAMIAFIGVFSLWDLLWIFLALSTAYQLGSGTSKLQQR